jgi:hypothetical protein
MMALLNVAVFNELRSLKIILRQKCYNLLAHIKKIGMRILSIKSYITDIITETKHGKIRTVQLKGLLQTMFNSWNLVYMIWKVTFVQILTMTTKKMLGWAFHTKMFYSIIELELYSSGLE